MISMSLTMDEVNRALANLVNAGYSPDFVMNPKVIADLFVKEVILKDGHKVNMSMEEYHEYTLNFNPPKEDTYNEYKEKKMVLEL